MDPENVKTADIALRHCTEPSIRDKLTHHLFLFFQLRHLNDGRIISEKMLNNIGERMDSLLPLLLQSSFMLYT